LAAERKRREALLPPKPVCERCAATDTLVLDADLSELLCADCGAQTYGSPVIEQHHIGGRRWPFVIDLTPNWHRIITALQRMRKGMKNGEMSELLFGIGDLIYGIGDEVAKLERERSDGVA
jgi:hypothetical protein